MVLIPFSFLIISPFEFGCLEPWTVILVSHQMLGANKFPPCLTLHKILNFLALFATSYPATLPLTHWMNFWPGSFPPHLTLRKVFERQKYKIDLLTFSFFHFSPLTFSFVNSVLWLSVFANLGLRYNSVIVVVRTTKTMPFLHVFFFFLIIWN